MWSVPHSSRLSFSVGTGQVGHATHNKILPLSRLGTSTVSPSNAFSYPSHLFIVWFLVASLMIYMSFDLRGFMQDFSRRPCLVGTPSREIKNLKKGCS